MESNNKQSIKDWVAEQVALVGNDYVDVDNEMRSGAEKIGELPDFLKAQFTVMNKETDSLNSWVELLKESGAVKISDLSSSEKEEFRRCADRLEVLSSIFWHDVRTYFGTHSANRSVEICTGFIFAYSCNCFSCQMMRSLKNGNIFDLFDVIEVESY